MLCFDGISRSRLDTGKLRRACLPQSYNELADSIGSQFGNYFELSGRIRSSTLRELRNFRNSASERRSTQSLPVAANDTFPEACQRPPSGHILSNPETSVLRSNQKCYSPRRSQRPMGSECIRCGGCGTRRIPGSLNRLSEACDWRRSASLLPRLPNFRAPVHNEVAPSKG